jgi:hypothetical protein
MPERAGKSANVKNTGVAIAVLAEPMSDSGDHKTYQITDATRQILDRTAAVVVYEGGVETAEAYTLERLNGKVIFDTVDATRGAITVDCAYLPATTVAYAHEFTLQRGCDILLLPKFGDEYKARLGGQKFASGTLSQWDVEDTYFSLALVENKIVVIEFKSHPDDKPIRVYAVFESNELKAAVAGMQDAVVSFISNDKVLSITD